MGEGGSSVCYLGQHYRAKSPPINTNFEKQQKVSHNDRSTAVHCPASAELRGDAHLLIRERAMSTTGPGTGAPPDGMPEGSIVTSQRPSSCPTWYAQDIHLQERRKMITNM